MICGGNQSLGIRDCKLSLKGFRNFIQKRFGTKIAEKFVQYFDFSMAWDYRDYIDIMEIFVHQSDEVFKRIIFDILDLDSDGRLSEIDLFMTMQTLHPDLFMKILSKDIIPIIQMIHKKKVDKGTDDESKLRLDRIQNDLSDIKKRHELIKIKENDVELDEKDQAFLDKKEAGRPSGPLEWVAQNAGDSDDDVQFFNTAIPQESHRGRQGNQRSKSQNKGNNQMTQKMISEGLLNESF